METLLEDYKRKLKTVIELLLRVPTQIPERADSIRLKVKASCYRTFITELEREIKNQSTP
jgi:uncharacterized protein Yka (UPF0111/DUF47 family)